MKAGKELNKGEIVETLNSYVTLLNETQSIFNYLKTAEKLPSDVYFSEMIFLDPTGEYIIAYYDETGADSGYFCIPIKAYLLDYELENFVNNFIFLDYDA